jgi:hypothetical protein
MGLLLLALAVLTLAGFAWLGRAPGRAASRLRLARGLLSALAAVAAVVVGLRGIWYGSLLLVGLSAWLGASARPLGPQRSAPPPRREHIGMSMAEARSMLGVDAASGEAEIEAAYRRLMQRAHPDHGGSTGLAAQLNAARDRLRGGR